MNNTNKEFINFIPYDAAIGVFRHDFINADLPGDAMARIQSEFKRYENAKNLPYEQFVKIYSDVQTKLSGYFNKSNANYAGVNMYPIKKRVGGVFVDKKLIIDKHEWIK